MKTLETFLSAIHEHIRQNGFDDVMDLIPLFIELDLSNWEALLSKKNGKPVTTTIFQSDKIRMSIIYWDGNQQSSIHGHAEGGGLIKVLDGRLEETRFDPEENQKMGTFLYPAGANTYIHDMFALHQVKNPDRKPAFSLHMYTRRAS